MATDGVLRFDTRIDEKGFNKGVKNISKGAKGISSALKGMGAAVAGFVALSAVKTMIKVADQAIELASDMQEVQNVVDTAFGSMAYKAEEFADVAIEQFGMSKLAAKQTASTYMAMGKSMGLSMEAASDMAIETAKLTGDVASFYNLGTDEAATKLKSIWTGETESLKELGVVMTETNLQQFAMNQGITKSLSAMSQAEKVALRYEYVMNALADAQGDFAKTSDSWANQTRVLSERWKELLSIIGGGLIRVLTPVITVINTILQALINLANTFAQTLGQLFGWNKEVKVSATTATNAAEGQEELAGATTAAGEAASGALASFDQLDVLQQDTGSSAAGAAGGGGGTQMELVDTEPLKTDGGVIDEIRERIERLQPYVDCLREAWEELRISFEEFINSTGVQACVQLFEDMADSIALVTAESVLGSLTGTLKTLSAEFDFWKDVLDTVVKLLNGDFSGAMESARGSFGDLGDVISGQKSILDSLPDWMLNAVNGVLGYYSTFLDAMSLLINIDWAGIWEKAKLFAEEKMSGLITTLSIEFESWKDIFDGIAKLLNGDFQGALENVGNAFGSLDDIITGQEFILNSLPDWMLNAANGMLEHYNNFLNAMSLLVNTDWLEIWENVKNRATEKLTTLKDNVILLWDGLKTNIVTTWDSMQTTMQTKWETFKSGMSGLLTSMKTNSQEILNQITTFLKGTFSKNWEAAWNGVKDIFKGVWNTIVSIVEGAVNLIIDAINWCINQINRIHIDVPDWVTELTGMTGFGFNIPNLSKVSIPRLATGAVIPPNGEFLAMLGDQRSGNNIEAPESLIRQIVREESGNGDIIINARGTMGQLIRLLKLEIDREDNRKGATFTPGGAY